MVKVDDFVRAADHDEILLVFTNDARRADKKRARVLDQDVVLELMDSVKIRVMGFVNVAAEVPGDYEGLVGNELDAGGYHAFDEVFRLHPTLAAQLTLFSDCRPSLSRSHRFDSPSDRRVRWS